jgi:hypothetical protein
VGRLRPVGLVPIVVRGDDGIGHLSPADQAVLVDGLWALLDELLGERDGPGRAETS